MIAVKVYYEDGRSEHGFIRECDEDESHFDVFFPFPCKVTNWCSNRLGGAMAFNANIEDVDYDRVVFI